ncbi:MAG: response regulator [Bacillota bacterium]
MTEILVVDDSKNNILVIKKCLEKFGYQVCTAGDGLEAIQKARKTEPDLILLDILLPKINGFLVFKTLNEDPKTEKIPVIFLSTKTEQKERDRAMSLGAKDYLIKPIKKRKLLNTVNKVLTDTHQDKQKS